MKRAILAGCLAALLFPGTPRAQSDEEAVNSDPEGLDMEAARPAAVSPTKGGVEQVSEVYTVKEGDTLWDLSQRFLGNPWYWPKVWSYNPEVENPHWIYPGNTLRFYPGSEEMPTQIAAPGQPEELTINSPGELADLSQGSIHGADLLGQEDDIVSSSGRIGFVQAKTTILRQDGFVTQRELDDAGVISRAFAEKDMLSTYDKVYVRFRNASEVRVGQRFVIFRTVKSIRHPHTGADFGFLTHVVGSLKVTAIDKHVATAVIATTLDDIGRGDFVGPWGSLEKQVISKAATREIQGVIVSSLEPSIPFMGEHHVVFIDKGRKDGVEEGNVFHAVRQGDPLRGSSSEAERYPKEDVATIVIVDVTNEAAAGLVVRSIRELAIGERVETRPAGARVSVAP